MITHATHATHANLGNIIQDVQNSQLAHADLVILGITALDPIINPNNGVLPVVLDPTCQPLLQSLQIGCALLAQLATTVLGGMQQGLTVLQGSTVPQPQPN